MPGLLADFAAQFPGARVPSERAIRDLHKKFFALGTINNVNSKIDRSQPLFYFVPQEKGLIWRPLWGRKNMGESIFHWEDGPPWGKMHPNWCSNMPRKK